MKTIQLVMGALALTLLLTPAPGIGAGNPGNGKEAAAKNTTLQVDPAKSSMTWTAKKVGGQHTGNVKIAKGSLDVKGNKLVGGTFDMDMTSITDTDLTNETFNTKLVNHLKSEDFFSVEKHPVSQFRITKVTPVANAKAGEPNYLIAGDLTIKGITKPISFPATVKLTGSSAEATAKFEVNRINWDIKYRSGIVGTVADKIIEDNFTIDLKVVAGKGENNS